MRAVKFEVSNDLLREALHLPVSATIEHVASSDSQYGTTWFVVSDPSIPEGSSPWESTPSITEHHYAWNWNVT